MSPSLETAAPAETARLLADAGSGGAVWWHLAGGLALVFGLLMLVMRLLVRWKQRGTGRSPASLLAVWPVGPRRDVQVLQLGDEVHYLYRQEAALVHLRRETLAAWHEAHPESRVTSAGAGGSWRRWLAPLGVAAGVAARRAAVSSAVTRS